MILPSEARTSYVVPALLGLGCYSLGFEQILMGTAAVESQFKFLTQFGGGPARGLFQMERDTFSWLLGSYLAKSSNANLLKAVSAMSTYSQPAFTELLTNHKLACAMAAIKFLSGSRVIPASLDEQAILWRKVYNGRSWRGLRIADYVQRWNELCAPIYAMRLDEKRLLAAYQEPIPQQDNHPMLSSIIVGNLSVVRR